MMDIHYMLDCSVLSETSKPVPDPAVLEFLETASCSIPSGALMELQFGIAQLMETNPKRAASLSNWYTWLVSVGIPIVETSSEVAVIWGALASDRQLKGLRVQDPRSQRERPLQDLHIAAAAIACGSVIATIDVHDFLLIHERHPLPGIYNPQEDKWYAGDPIRSMLKSSSAERSLRRVSLDEFMSDSADRRQERIVAQPSDQVIPSSVSSRFSRN